MKNKKDEKTKAALKNIAVWLFRTLPTLGQKELIVIGIVIAIMTALWYSGAGSALLEFLFELLIEYGKE